MSTSELVYTSSSFDLEEAPAIPANALTFEDPYYEMNDWCAVCSRSTDHRGEHDDLKEAGLVQYHAFYGYVGLV